MGRAWSAAAATIGLFLAWYRWHQGHEPGMPFLMGWGLLVASFAFGSYALWPQWARLKRFRRRLRFQNPIIFQSPVFFEHDDGRWRFYLLCGDWQKHVIARRGFSTKALDEDAYSYYSDLPRADQGRVHNFWGRKPKWHFTKDDIETARLWVRPK